MYVNISKRRLMNAEGEYIYPNSDSKVIVPLGERTSEYVGYYSTATYTVYYDGEVRYISATPYDIEGYYSQLLNVDDDILIKGKGDTIYTVVGSGKKMYRAEDLDGNEIRRYYVNKKGELTFEIYNEPEVSEEINIEESHGFDTFIESVKTNPIYDNSEYDKGIYKNYAAAVNAKSHLREILSKHPSWNEEQQCVEIPIHIMSEFNSSCVNNAVINFNRIVSEIPMFSRTTLRQWDRVTARFDTCYMECNDGVVKFKSYIGEQFKTHSDCNSEEVCLKDINVTKKASRVISAIMDKFKVPRTPEVEKGFAVLADELSIKEKKYKFILSINPTDFITMSHGNSWHSCHSFRDRGCYHAGSLSYALDKCTMIAYIIPEDATGDYCKVDKIKRLLYMMDNNDKGFMSTKMYPDNNDSSARNSFDNAVASILYDCGIREEFSENYDGSYSTVGLHYPDYSYGFRKYFSNNIKTHYSVGAHAYSFDKTNKYMDNASNCTGSRVRYGAVEAISITPEIEEALASAVSVVAETA